MKKFLTAVLLVGLLAPFCYGATSGDMSVYVRQDVFEAKIDAFMAEIRGEFQVINAKLEALDKRITDSETHTSNRIEDLKQNTNNRLDDLRTVIYWGLSIIGLLVAFAIFAPSFGEFLRNVRKPAVTLDDMKRLIEENNVALRNSIQM